MGSECSLVPLVGISALHDMDRDGISGVIQTYLKVGLLQLLCGIGRWWEQGD